MRPQRSGDYCLCNEFHQHISYVPRATVRLEREGAVPQNSMIKKEKRMTQNMRASAPAK